MQGLIEKHRTRMAKESYSSSSCRVGEKKTMIEVLLSLQEKEAEYYTDEIIRGLMLVSFTIHHTHRPPISLLHASAT